MTDAEREAIDDNPLWTLTGQILWYLDQRTDGGLVQASEIAADLDVVVADVSAALQALQGDAALSSRQVGGRRLWGTHGQMQRLLGDERQARHAEAARVQRIIDSNGELDAIKAQLAEVLSGRGIDVTTLRGMFPSQAVDSHPDHLVITTSDVISASWLLEKLRDSPDPGDEAPSAIVDATREGRGRQPAGP
jgi:hypothetical protein